MSPDEARPGGDTLPPKPHEQVTPHPRCRIRVEIIGEQQPDSQQKVRQQLQAADLCMWVNWAAMAQRLLVCACCCYKQAWCGVDSSALFTPAACRWCCRQ